MAMIRFDKIARECRSTHKGDTAGIPIVGLEHIEPGEMLLHAYDVDVETTFTKTFKKGQILFGRRRAYQHKACVATCSGICSGDITVIEPIEGCVDPNLLPFIIHNDSFFDHAIKGSNGALSPRVKWEHMANYELNLPPLSEQKLLAEKLWAAYKVKQSYIKMIEATDEMVKSQFIEMFGDPILNSKDLPQMKVKDISSKVGSGATPSGGDSSYKNEGISLVRSLNVYNNKFLYKDLAHIDEDQAKKLDNVKLVSKDILLNITGASVTRCCIVPDNILPARVNQHVCIIRIQNKNVLCPEFCNYMFTSASYQSYLWILASAAGTTRQALTKNQVEQLNVIVPPMEDQLKFVAIAEQADKSKFELRKSIEAIDRVIKSLINIQK